VRRRTSSSSCSAICIDGEPQLLCISSPPSSSYIPCSAALHLRRNRPSPALYLRRPTPSPALHRRRAPPSPALYPCIPYFPAGKQGELLPPPFFSTTPSLLCCRTRILEEKDSFLCRNTRTEHGFFLDLLVDGIYIHSLCGCTSGLQIG
jgi:hypothetical protein